MDALNDEATPNEKDEFYNRLENTLTHTRKLEGNHYFRLP